MHLARHMHFEPDILTLKIGLGFFFGQTVTLQAFPLYNKQDGLTDLENLLKLIGLSSEDKVPFLAWLLSYVNAGLGGWTKRVDILYPNILRCFGVPTWFEKEVMNVWMIDPDQKPRRL